MKTKKFLLISLLVWAFPIVVFWCFKGVLNPMLYSIIFWHGWYNVYAVVVSFVVGKNNVFGAFKWFVPLIIGVLNAMTYPVTFGLANDINTGVFDSMEIDIRYLINYVILSIVGVVAGVIIGFIVNGAKDRDYNGFLFIIPGWMWGFIIAWLFPIIKFGATDFQPEFFSIFLYIWYMLLAFSVSILIGRGGSVGVHKSLQVVILLLLNTGVYPLTVGIVEMQNGSALELIDVKYCVCQVAITAVGFFIGMLIYYVCNRKVIKE